MQRDTRCRRIETTLLGNPVLPIYLMFFKLLTFVLHFVGSLFVCMTTFNAINCIYHTLSLNVDLHFRVETQCIMANR